MFALQVGRTFSRGVALLRAVGALAIAGCYPEIQGLNDAEWEAALASYSAHVYGQVTVARSDSAAVGVSVVVTVYRAGCTGEMAEAFSNQTTTDADGRFQVNSNVWKSSLPSGNPDSRVLCARTIASGKLPGDTASLLIPDLVHRAVMTADSTRADLRLP